MPFTSIFLAMHCDMHGCLNTNTHLTASNFQDLDRDRFPIQTHNDTFAALILDMQRLGVGETIHSN